MAAASAAAPDAATTACEPSREPLLPAKSEDAESLATLEPPMSDSMYVDGTQNLLEPFQLSLHDSSSATPIDIVIRERPPRARGSAEAALRIMREWHQLCRDNGFPDLSEYGPRYEQYVMERHRALFPRWSDFLRARKVWMCHHLRERGRTRIR
jgi:hypothetical protein